MSIKKLFGKEENFRILDSTSKQDLTSSVESEAFASAVVERKETFIPHVDFTKPENFVRYGSAEEYYKNSVSRIYRTYPYDGSLYEKELWHLSSSYLDRYVFEKRYPRTTGYAVFSLGSTGWGTRVSNYSGSLGMYGAPATASYEYITVKGGPNPNSNDLQAQDIVLSFTGSNLYHTASNRESNLRLNLDRGVTLEFWLRKESFTVDSKTHREVIFDLWNGQATSSAADPAYGRLRLELSGTGNGESPFRLTLLSGASNVGFSNQVIGTGITTSTVANNSWSHYALSLKNEGNAVRAKFYVTGALNQTTLAGSTSVGEITGSLIANIGALRTSPSGSDYNGRDMEGHGKLSGSIDEFRYWKTRRTSEQIGRYWFTQIGGGTNTDPPFTTNRSDTANTHLGVYYKFNEGVTGDSSIDSTVLDYSGRISNGTWTGYASGARITGSALNEINKSGTGSVEFRDPIIYSSHPEVKRLQSDLAATGSVYDRENNASIYYSFPDWIVNEDDDGELLKLTQIVSSYFDTLHLQVEAMPGLKNIGYNTSGSIPDKPYPFTDRILESAGFITPEIFADASILEQLMDRNEKMKFGDKLSNIKNLIYQNIYNNLVYIYKTKGTEKSFRNLIRCFGVDEDVVKINLYGSDIEYKFDNRFETRAVTKRYADFNHTDRFSATVFQNSSSTNANTVSFISGSGIGVSSETDYEKQIPITVEAEVILPLKLKEDQKGYFRTDFLSSSLFGMHTANSADSENLSWPTKDYANFQVYVVRKERESEDAYFMLSASSPETGKPRVFSTLTSSLFKDVYNNQKWNFAVRLKPTSLAHTASSNFPRTGPSSYTIEFQGVNTEFGTVRSEFTLTGTVDHGSGSNFLIAPKRLYAGAHRTNFTGTVLAKSDVKVSSLRYWASDLSATALRAHARDPLNFGAERAYRSSYLFENSYLTFDGPKSRVSGTFVPQIETLALNWDLATVTSSDGSGEFVVDDFSSGSADMTNRYGWLGNILYKQHSGRGYGFVANATSSVDKDYVYAARQQLPEVLNYSDTTTIAPNDDYIFTRESRPTHHFFAPEISMYRTISEEMLNMFATIVEFNNLVGEPVNKYRPKYKGIEKLRNLFFERLRNTPDLDKFVDFYQWIDHSLSKMLLALVPGSANFSEDVRMMVESHLLERNKYRWKYMNFNEKEPTLAASPNDPEGTNPDPKDKEDPDKPTKDKDPRDDPRKRPKPPKDYTRDPRKPRKPRRNPRPPWEDPCADAVDHPGKYLAAPVDEKKRPEDQGEKPCDPWWTYKAPRREGKLAGATYSDAGTVRTKEFDIAKHRIYIAKSQVLQRNRRNVVNAQVDLLMPLHGGINDVPNKKRDFVYTVTQPLGKIEFPGVPLNVLLSFNDKIVKRLSDCCPDKKEIIFKEIVGERWPAYEFKAISGREHSYDYGYGKGHLLFPHTLVSSSGPHLNTDYNEALQTDATGKGYKKDSSLENLHSDGHGIHEQTLQSPFTERFVGGRQHRHIDHNRGSDNWDNRPEAWRILINKCSAGGALGYVSADYPYPSASLSRTDQGFPYLTLRPKAVFTREEVSKRPVNVRNIRMTSSYKTQYVSGVLQSSIGNFEKNYQVLQTSGRLAQRPLMHTVVEGDGQIAANQENIAVRGRLPLEITSGLNSFATQNFTLPTRPREESVWVERFSAPGGPEVMSRGYMDPAAEEYSAYNAIPYRNRTVLGWSGAPSLKPPVGISEDTGLVGAGVGATSSIKASDHAGKRRGLYTNLSLHSGRFGHDISFGSVTSTLATASVPSYHKVQRNTLYRYKLSGSRQEYGNQDNYTNSQFKDLDVLYDNWWIQHPIPRSDRQYAWITASLMHHAHGRSSPFGYASGSNEIIFMTSSNYGMFRDSTGNGATPQVRYWYWPMTAERASTGVGSAYIKLHLHNLVGMNAALYDPMLTSSRHPDPGVPTNNTVGYTTYTTALFATASTHHPGYPQYANRTFILTFGGYNLATDIRTGAPYFFNALMLHRNGPYQRAGWQRIRGAEHPVMRYHNRNNIMTVQDPPKSYFSPGGAIIVSDRLADSFKTYTETRVTTKFKPLLHIYDRNTSAGVKRLALKHTYGNDLSTFANPELRERVYGSGHNMPENLIYNELLELNDNLPADTSMKGFVYTETVFPREQNAYLHKIRGRTDFVAEFWSNIRGGRAMPTIPMRWRVVGGGSNAHLPYTHTRNISTVSSSFAIDTYGDDKRAAINLVATGLPGTGSGVGNVIGYGFDSGSRWPLDARTDFSVSSSGQYAVGLAASASTQVPYGIIASQQNYIALLGDGAGELQNNYTTFARHTGSTTSGKSHGHAFLIPGCVYNMKVASGSCRGNLRVVGDTKWEAGKQAGKTPFYQTYEDYALNMRTAGKDYTVVPEFRISEHMEHYVKNGFHIVPEKGGTKKGTFELVGGTLSSSLESDFYKTYSHTDFLRFFADIKSDYKDIAEPNGIALECKALVKFLPYNGFYPALRGLQMAQLFVDSYKDSLALSNSDYETTVVRPYVHPTDQTKGIHPALIRGMMNPLFAGPGVFWNTIKSGLAVDWPVFAGEGTDAWANGEADKPLADEIYNNYLHSNGIITGSHAYGSPDGTAGRYHPAQQAYPYQFKNREEISDGNFKYLDFNGASTNGSEVRFGGGSAAWNNRLTASAGADVWTISCWINARSRGAGNYGRIWDFGNGDRTLYMNSATGSLDDFNLRVYINAAGDDGKWKVATKQSADSSAGLGKTRDTYLKYNRWHHIVVRHSASAGSGPVDDNNNSTASKYDNMVEIWVDGISGSTTDQAPGGAARAIEGGDFVIGNRSIGDRAFDGGIDEFMIFNGAITNAQVKTLFNNGAPPYKGDLEQDDASLMSQLIHYWRFGGGSDAVNTDGGIKDQISSEDETDPNGTAANVSLRAHNKNVATVNHNTVSPTAGRQNNRSLYNSWITSQASTNYHFRMPFETLVEPEPYFATVERLKTNYNFGPHPNSWFSSSLDYIDTRRMVGDPRYKLAMHNFLAESVSFFLEDNLTSFVSNPEALFKNFTAGTTYKMRVKINRQNIEMYDRPSAFGPPCMAIDGRTNSPWTGSMNVEKLKPTFSPFTPPYYNTHTNFNTTEPDGTITERTQPCYAEISFTPETSGQYTLQQIFSAAKVSYVRDLWVRGPSTEEFDDGYRKNKGYNAHDKMNLSASVNLLSQARMKLVQYNAVTGQPTTVTDSLNKDELLNVWAIETKYETPMLDFSNVSKATAGVGDDFTAKGMWHQYGDIPNARQGVYLTIEGPTLEEVREGRRAGALVGDLREQVGFDGTSRRIGQIAASRKFREAVVAVPFVEKDGVRHFFNLSDTQIDHALGHTLGNINLADTAGKSVKQMVEAMQRYVIPPHMDFITSGKDSAGKYKIKPFCMYIFEFEFEFSQQDLADIWQNLPPESGLNFEARTTGTPGGVRSEKSSAIICHPILRNEFFGKTGFPSGLRWMVFKVKQKAEKNYFAKTLDSRDDDRFKFTFNLGNKQARREAVPDYSYNWPYDFFSMIELIKVDAQTLFGNPVNERPPPRELVPTDRQIPEEDDCDDPPVLQTTPPGDRPGGGIIQGGTVVVDGPVRPTTQIQAINPTVQNQPQNLPADPVQIPQSEPDSQGAATIQPRQSISWSKKGVKKRKKKR